MSARIDLSDLPPRYAYLLPLLGRHMTHFGDVNAYYSLLKAMQPGGFEELKQIYLEIERRGDADDLAKWVVSQYPLSRKSGAGDAVFDLFGVFGILAQEGIEPFVRRAVEIRDEIPCSDWSKVPQELSYLLDGAKKYGGFHASNQRSEFLEGATRRDFQELDKIAAHIRGKNHSNAIFLRTQDTLDPAAMRIAYLLELLRDAQIDFGDN